MKGINEKKRITAQSKNMNNLLVSDGNFLPTAETAVANTRPRSAITVSVNGIPINANNIQNPLPLVVTGTMLP